MAISEIDKGTLLVHMPIAGPFFPNLATELLAATSRQAGYQCDVLYGTLKYKASSLIGGVSVEFDQRVFAHSYHDLDIYVLAERLALSYYDKCLDPDDLYIEALNAIDSADRCLNECLDIVKKGRYGIVGFSVGFEQQKLASLTLAKLIKEFDPSIHIIFGGTGCDGIMGDALIRNFQEVDIVVQGEADKSFVHLLAALHNGESVKDRCYCLYRENNKFFRTGELEVTRNLDELPIPNYTSFFSQLSASIYGKTEGAACLTTVLIESSRGCWWGDKSRCKFCGITSVLPGYRQKSPERFLDEIKKIVQEYHVNSVFMTDSILPFSYYDTVLPELASWRRDDKNAPRIYYEIKSNIHRKHMARLALAGILDIQPGIESFSSHILHLVKKGVSMLQQVELLKWAKSYGIECIYNIIYGIPYAGVEDYNTMIEVMSKIHHLHPPYCNRLLCFRFSQYASDPDKYKLDHIRPNQIDREAFGLPDSELMDFCYDLAYDYVGTDREELESVYKRLFREVHDWIDDHNIHGATLTSIALEKSILIKRVFNAKTPEITLLSGSDAQIYDLAQETISIRILAERSNIPVETVREIVSRFVHDGLMLEENGHVLALATPKDFDIWADADLESLRPPLAEQCYCGSLTN